MSETFAFLKECGPFFISTVNGEAPATRPFGGVMEYQGSLYVATSNKKDVYSQMKTNPNVQIVALKAAEKAWIRINGKVEEIFDLDAKQAMLDACPPLLKNFPAKDTPTLALFKITKMSSFLYTGGDVTQLA